MLPSQPLTARINSLFTYGFGMIPSTCPYASMAMGEVIFQRMGGYLFSGNLTGCGRMWCLEGPRLMKGGTRKEPMWTDDLQLHCNIREPGAVVRLGVYDLCIIQAQVL